MDPTAALQSPAAGARKSNEGALPLPGADPGPSGGHPEVPMMAPPSANHAPGAPHAAHPDADAIKAEPTSAAPVLSPALALTPATHVVPAPQAPATATTPFADPMMSPVRPAAAILGAAPSPIPPPSAGKQEVADAAMALTWLAEALTAPAPELPLVAPAPAPAPRRKTSGSLRSAASLPRSESSGSRRKAASVSLYASLEQQDSELTVAAPAAPVVTTGLRGRRAASQRCTTVIQEAIMNERLLAANPRTAAAAAAAEGTGRAPRRAPAARNSEAAAAAAERKIKGYSENSRVGRAMAAILQYVEEHEPQYAAAGGGGVPERVIRGEFGNNPDTSKALRFLVGEKKIIRKGLGGRRDPFNYVLAEGVSPSAARALAAAIAAPAPALAPVLPPARAISPAESAEENAGVNAAQGASFMSPPAADPTSAAAAAAAALNAPSTGKWPATAPRRAVVEGAARRKPLQPRLSLGMAEGLPGVKRPALMAAAPPAKRVALENSPEAIAATPAAPVIAFAIAGQPPSTAAAGSVAAKTGSMVTPAAELIQAHVAQQAQRAAQGTSGILAWPSQLPSTQRLSTLATPPPLATTPAPAPAPIFLPNASAAVLRSNGTAATPQQAQAYIQLQLQAQMMLRQQMAAQAAGGGATEGAPQVPTLAATQHA